MMGLFSSVRMRPWRLLIPAVAAAACLAQAQKPEGLRATSATKSKVELAWTAVGGAAGYKVERRLAGTSEFSVIGSPTDATFTDTKIGPMATYVYRVRASAKGAPSNQIVVGPPAPGFHVAAPSPKGRESDFGIHTCMELDANGDPILAYVFDDPNRDTNHEDTELYFLTWSRAKYRWDTPVPVATVGAIGTGNQPQVAIARDRDTSAIGIAHQKGLYEIWLAVSNDGGATWKDQLIQPSSKAGAGLPSLAMAKGKAHIAAYNREDAVTHQFDGIRYYTITEEGGAVTSMPCPILPDTKIGKSATPSLALDYEGQVGIAYFLECGGDLPHAYNVVLAFWRPGAGAWKVADSAEHPIEDPAVTLAFDGTQPRAVFYMPRTKDTYGERLWFAQSKDGQSWTDPVNLRQDGSDYWYSPMGLAIDEKGRVAISVPINTSGGGAKFGRPKILRSSDLVSWTISSPDSSAEHPMRSAWAPGVRFWGNGRVYVAFQHAETGTKLPPGVVVWREP